MCAVDPDDPESSYQLPVTRVPAMDLCTRRTCPPKISASLLHLPQPHKTKYQKPNRQTNNLEQTDNAPRSYFSELTKCKPQQNHFLTFSHQTHRPGKMIIFKVQGVRCTPKPYHLHLPAWHSHKPASKTQKWEIREKIKPNYMQTV